MPVVLWYMQASAPSFYAFGVVLMQLLTEQGPLGLLSAVKEALDNNTLMNLVPRLPADSAMQMWSTSFAKLAQRCTQPGGINILETDLLPALEDLGSKLSQLGSSAMSWEQVEEMLMLPLQPRSGADVANRRWVRTDFRMRRKMFLEEVRGRGSNLHAFYTRISARLLHGGIDIACIANTSMFHVPLHKPLRVCFPWSRLPSWPLRAQFTRLRSGVPGASKTVWLSLLARGIQSGANL